MIKKIISIIGLIFITYFTTFQCDAKKIINSTTDIYELSIDENIAIPILGKYSSKIVAFQETQTLTLQSLTKKGYPFIVNRMRNNEVISITIPAKYLFTPNSSAISEKGKEILKPLHKYFKQKGLYKMVLVMHSDNTGNDNYAMNLTTKRVNSVFDAFAENTEIQTEYIIPYALGNSDPIVNNNSVENRDKNRRLVIYLIPENGMIQQAKKGEIAL